MNISGSVFWRIIDLLAIMFLAVGALAACTATDLAEPSTRSSETSSTTPEALTEVVACTSNIGYGSWLLVYAAETGLFEQFGLRVEVPLMGSGSTAMSALLAGDSDLCVMSGTAVANAAIVTEEPVVVAGLVNKQPYSLMVLPYVEQPDDLRGKAVAVSGPGSASDAYLRLALEQLGLDPEREVAIVAIGGSTERAAALESGQVAGAVVLLDQAPVLKNAGFKELLEPGQIDVPFLSGALVTTRPFLEDNRELTTNFLKALVSARAAMIEDTENGPEIIADALLLESEEDRNNIREIYLTVLNEYVERVPIPEPETLSEALTTAKEENPGGHDVAAIDVIDASIAQELLASGFIDSLYDQK